MGGRFSRALARLHGTASARLADAIGTYQNGQQAPVGDLDLMLDRGVQLEGANEAFLASTVAITWAVAQMPRAERGGVFAVGLERFTVEQVIADDGHMITAACMVTT